MYIASGRRTYSGTARKEEKNGERETRLTQGGFWLIGQTYKFVATYPWITWRPGTLVGPRTSVPLLRENATHRGTRPRSYLRHRPEASFLTADRTRATRAYAMRLVQPPLLYFFLPSFLTCSFICSPARLVCSTTCARGYYCPPPIVTSWGVFVILCKWCWKSVVLNLKRLYHYCESSRLLNGTYIPTNPSDKFSLSASISWQ